MIIIRFIFIFLLVIPVVNAAQYHFQFENDVIFGEDGNYSNGMIFGWESSATPQKLNPPIAFYNWQQSLLFSQKDARQAWGVKVTQRMWTPDEIKIYEAQPYERPYAGFLELEQHRVLYSSDIAQKTWLAIGIVGPASGTEKLQGTIHRILHVRTPEGWQYQVENTPTIQLAYEIDYLLLRKPAHFNSQWELSSFNHNTLGNFRSDINVGLTLRWGFNLQQSFGRLSSHFGHVGDYTSVARPQSWLFFSRVQTGYRFNDLTLDGKLPYESQVEFNPYRASAEIGLIYYYFSGGAVTWSFNFYNKEYISDKKSWYGYGLLQFSWTT